MSNSPRLHVLCPDPHPSRAVESSLRRLGIEPVTIQSRAALEDPCPLFVHSRASFGAAMEALVKLGGVDPLRARLACGAPTLLVGTAFQILAAGSEENPGVEGIGLFDVILERFDDELPLPQLGWNVSVPESDAQILLECYAYFHHTYAMRRAPKRWSAAWSEYDGPFVAGLEHGSIVACQFHPEISGGPGSLMIHNWLQRELATC